jgi:hypothetical protein
MLPLQYEQLVREYRRQDLLREAAQQRRAVEAWGTRAVRSVHKSTLDVVCRLPLPVLEPACTAQPA